ncbi:hypothetical protein H5410_046720 [Solanum commersonii]|uniref:Uncharacterized protein n=1 Tax=Solanum commersonii TaxID=4109 RepID=A0A9J5XGI7_SOLCO|nr:hypothetical protein H5410_046720 [Solanum commersonii]
MADREIGMDSRKGTSRSPPGQRDRFSSEAHVPPASPVPLVPEEATDTRPPVPIVSPPEISGQQGIREVVQLLTRMASIHE